MPEHLRLPCRVTVAVIALSAILFKEFLKKRAGQTAVEGSADNDSATENGTVERAARTCTTPQVDKAATSSGHDYEVFLSFRGPDTRSGFTDYLYTSLTDAGIRTFKDDKDLHIGEKFAPELLEAINQSRISIPIFSKDYASSIWCLKELVQMVKRQENEKQKIMPIFYDVTPSDVRRQTGSFKKAFVSHKRKRRYDEKTIAEWKDALTTVADINGWDLQSMPNRQEGQFAKTITQKVFNELKKAYLVVSNCLVNVDNHVDAITELIGPHTSETQIIGIYGMGGIGKTTTAKIIYNQLLEKFECCCFLSNIRETSERKGIEFLQNQLISDILKNKCTDITNIDDGIKTIKDRLSNKRVLLLLDDVHETKHMDALAGKCDWFGKGSKLIITTRNKEVLDVSRVKSCYELWGMDHNQSLQLFSKHAFRSDHPLDKYINQSERAIKIAGGLPLALELMGSLLSNTKKEKWESKLRKWESDPLKDVQSRLKISYDVLEDKEKQIFLDIACLLIGYDKDIAVHFWESEFHPEYAMDVLENMSLIKIKEDNKVWMHDQLRDLGRQIACQETNINKQIREWDPKKALDILKSHEMKKKVEALRLHLDHQQCFTYEDFKSLPNLRFLEVDDPKEIFRAKKMLFQHKGPSNVLSTNVFWKNSNLLPRLRWLSWRNIHPTFEITNFSMENVILLDLSQSEITNDWKGWNHMKVIKNLKVLNLAHCQCLKRTPDFSAHSNLEHLILSSCESLIEIDGSICQLKRLVFLDVSDCWNLQRLPETVGNLDSLTKLDISHTSIEEVPNSIGMLMNLQVMKMQNDVQNRTNNDACKKLGKVKGMEFADRYSHVTHVHTISGWRIYGKSSEEILGWPGVHALPRFPESLIELEVEELRVDTFPDLSNLANLKVLHLGFGPPNCDGKSYGLLEKQIPRWIGNLSKLESLLLCFFGGTDSSIDLSLPPHPPLLLRLPSSLSVLHLYGCDSLGSMDLSNLRKLSDLDICCSAVAEIEGLGCLENLRKLRLEKLRQLAMLPDLSKLNKLRHFEVTSCGNLVEIQGELPRFLDYLSIYSGPLQEFPDLFYLIGKTHVYVHVQIDNQIFEYTSGRRWELCGFKQMQILDISNLDGIRHLSVKDCHNLVEIQGELPQSLEKLKIEDCGSLQKLPELSSLKRLQEVAIRYLNILMQIPDLSNLDEITDLSVICCHNLVEIQGELPQSLEKLCIKWCESLQKLHELSSLKRLREVTIIGCEKLDSFLEFPDLFSLMGKTKVSTEFRNQKFEYSGGHGLHLSGFKQMQIPDLSNLDGIRYLSVADFHNLVEIQGELPQSLEELYIDCCESLQKLPELSSLKRLRKVTIEGLNILMQILDLSNLDRITDLSVRYCHNLVEIQSELPQSLEELQFYRCESLQKLPELSSLKRLRKVRIGGLNKLMQIPDLSNLDEITDLSVSDCHNLVEIQGELPQSLEELWIYSCESLQKLPELSSLKRLREVTIKGLNILMQIPDLSNLNEITYLSVGNCYNLVEIQGELPQSLEELYIDCCESLQKLPKLSSSKRLRKVTIGGLNILMQILDLSNLDGITDLSVTDCHNLVEIQGELPQSLEELLFYRCESLQKLPELSSLKKLRNVRIEGLNKLMQIPDLSNLDEITDLLVSDCHNLVEIQGELPHSLEKLWIDNCESLQKLPELSSLKRLRWVTIKGLNILMQIPDLSNLDGITDLSVRDCHNLVEIQGELPQSLEELYIDCCESLQKLPKLSSLKRLQKVTIIGLNILMQIPDLSNLDKITDLSVRDCHNLVEIQSELPQSLEELYIDCCESLQKLPELSSLKRLQKVTIRGLNILMQIPDLSNLDEITDLSIRDCHNLVEIQGELPQSLKKLYIDCCESLQKLPQLSSLKRLREITIKGCRKLDVEEISRLCLEKSIEFVGDDEEDEFVEEDNEEDKFVEEYDEEDDE